MTTTFMKTTGIPLYKYEGEVYCKMIDVIKLIHHEFYENEDKSIRRILDRMEMRIAKNDFLLKDAEKPTVLQNKTVPGRYAVGYCDENNTWHFYSKTENDQTIFSVRPCEAKLYVNCRDAFACADFLEEKADVLDFEANMSEEDRWLRELRIPFPYDADEGNEKAIPVEIVT